MNIPIVESGKNLAEHKFIRIDSFYDKTYARWIPASTLYGNGNVESRYLSDILNNLNGDGTVKHLTELHDQANHSMIEFQYQYGGETKVILAKGSWGLGITKSKTLVPLDKDGRVMRHNYTTLDYINNNGTFNKPSIKIHSQELREYLKKIRRIDYVGKTSHHKKDYDAFMIHCSALESGNGASFFALGHLNNSVFPTNFFDSI